LRLQLSVTSWPFLFFLSLYFDSVAPSVFLIALLRFCCPFCFSYRFTSILLSLLFFLSLYFDSVAPSVFLIALLRFCYGKLLVTTTQQIKVFEYKLALPLTKTPRLRRCSFSAFKEHVFSLPQHHYLVMIPPRIEVEPLFLRNHN
jgi:hypothetical protein